MRVDADCFVVEGKNAVQRLSEGPGSAAISGEDVLIVPLPFRDLVVV